MPVRGAARPRRPSQHKGATCPHWFPSDLCRVPTGGCLGPHPGRAGAPPSMGPRGARSASLWPHPWWRRVTLALPAAGIQGDPEGGHPGLPRAGGLSCCEDSRASVFRSSFHWSVFSGQWRRPLPASPSDPPWFRTPVSSPQGVGPTGHAR